MTPWRWRVRPGRPSRARGVGYLALGLVVTACVSLDGLTGGSTDGGSPRDVQATDALRGADTRGGDGRASDATSAPDGPGHEGRDAGRRDGAGTDASTDATLPDARGGDASDAHIGDAGPADAPDAGSFDARHPGDAATAKDSQGAADVGRDNAAPDAAGCGSCAGTCLGGRCLLLLASGAPVVDLAVDGANVYWTTVSYQVDEVSAVSGGSATVLAQGTPTAPPAHVASDGMHVYFTVPTNPGVVVAAPVGGGGAVVTLASGRDTPQRITWDPVKGGVYWAEAGGDVMRYQPGSGAVTTIATGGGGDLDGIAAYNDNVYWAPGNGNIYGCSTSQQCLAPLQPFESAQADALGVAAGPSGVYWDGTGANGSISTATLAGGPVLDLVSGAGAPLRVAVDSNSLYWVNGSSLMKSSRGGLMATTLFTSTQGVTAMVIDGTDGIYWSEGAGGIWKLSPR